MWNSKRVRLINGINLFSFFFWVSTIWTHSKIWKSIFWWVLVGRHDQLVHGHTWTQDGSSASLDVTAQNFECGTRTQRIRVSLEFIPTVVVVEPRRSSLRSGFQSRDQHRGLWHPNRAAFEMRMGRGPRSLAFLDPAHFQDCFSYRFYELPKAFH